MLVLYLGNILAGIWNPLTMGCTRPLNVTFFDKVYLFVDLFYSILFLICYELLNLPLLEKRNHDGWC